MYKMILKLSRVLTLYTSFISPAYADEEDSLYYGYNPPNTQSKPYLIDFDNQVLDNYLKPDPKSKEGYFAVGSAPQSGNKTAMILFVAKDFSNAANVNSSDGIVLLNLNFTTNSKPSECLFISSNSADIVNIGPNQNGSRFMPKLSDTEIEIIAKVGCVAFERRSGPKLV